ncbi:hypothetical protein MACH17_20830 [Phaeobacter inhibens]|uniref:Mu-like prophage major head subunit gpT family protein n=1 Tax=Phaeobacter inhibens TaxID=221822 RepID=UPI002768A56C|nr:Mu-like prophage major head subunit gpT family protein [Phaeobacter inhibens]GLO70566.1 hypothetical protein MACH17_20830 [Phaeobacter inhibens]
MLINAANLDALRAGLKTSFQGGLGQAPSMHKAVSPPVPSTQKEQKYGWLGKIPNVREWIGARAVQNLSQHDYAIKEKPWELTIGVDRDDIETDNLGIYGMLFTEMGQSTGSKWDMLVFEALKNGFVDECYDGQPYFDTDHPVLDEDGQEISVANTDGGNGVPWFLLDIRDRWAALHWTGTPARAQSFLKTGSRPANPVAVAKVSTTRAARPSNG